MVDRRHTLQWLAGAGLAPGLLSAQGSMASSSLDPWSSMRWGRGIEGQRRADLGHGRFLNPIVAGDHPDPSILRVVDDYYLTFSSFDSYPGLVIWHSRDLVNWSPVTAALRTPVGSVWAPDLSFHAGLFYCYFPARTATRRSNYVITAPRIEGPWSDPVDLELRDVIDPAHAVDEQGRRWLYLSGGNRVPLRADGLAIAGPIEHIYDPWHYPEDWVVEGFAPEGPKLVLRAPWWYLITAVGGTAGPPTGHMVIAARSRTLGGPWEHCPRNPLVRTRSAREKWWSRGHATLFEGPQGRWYFIYHGYENGYWTLGRQTLLEPVDWSADGWPVARGGDLSQPLRKPIELGPQPQPPALSDDFSSDRLGTQWSFYDPAPGEAARLSRGADGLSMAGKGHSPADCSPLTCIAGDLAYRIAVDIEVDADSEGGLLLFYNRRLYAGLGFNARGLMMHRQGLPRALALPPGAGRRLRISLSNDHNIVTLHTSSDGGTTWRKFDVQMEVSGYHHNVAYDFLSLRPALYAAGAGRVRFARFEYQALD
jgi:xylan 1,4-beta-xylosidase